MRALCIPNILKNTICKKGRSISVRSLGANVLNYAAATKKSDRFGCDFREKIEKNTDMDHQCGQFGRVFHVWVGVGDGKEQPKKTRRIF